MDLIESIKVAILPSIENNHCYLEDIVYENEKNEWYLRIYIDKVQGSLDMDTCVIVSEEINQILDEKDFIKNEYYLEVSSPGAERQLKDLPAIIKAIGEYIYIKLKDPKNGIHEIYGTLKEVNDTMITIEYKDKSRKKAFTIDYNNVKVIRMAIEF